MVIIIINNNANDLLNIWNFIMGVQLRLVSKQAEDHMSKERMMHISLNPKHEFLSGAI